MLGSEGRWPRGVGATLPAGGKGGKPTTVLEDAFAKLCLKIARKAETCRTLLLGRSDVLFLTFSSLAGQLVSHPVGSHQYSPLEFFRVLEGLQYLVCPSIITIRLGAAIEGLSLAWNFGGRERQRNNERRPRRRYTRTDVLDKLIILCLTKAVNTHTLPGVSKPTNSPKLRIGTSLALLSLAQAHSNRNTLWTVTSQSSCISASVMTLAWLASKTDRAKTRYLMLFKAA